VTDPLHAVGVTEGQVLALLLVLGRIAPLFAMAPLFSATMLPPRVRALCAIGLAFGLAPIVSHGTDPKVPEDALGLVSAIGGEVLVGMAFAFTVSVLFAAVSAAGALLDTSIGFSYGSLIDPITGTQASVLSHLYAMVGVLVFIAIGGDGWLIAGLARTYDLVPLAHMPSVTALAVGANRAFVGIFAAAVQVAAPALVALVLTDAAFGVVSRAVPQMNVFAVGFPAKIIVGLLVISASLPFFGGWLADHLQQTVGDALRTVGTA
jgi:flagellar biosynthetic protein FliR